MTWGSHCPRCGREDCAWEWGGTCDGMGRISAGMPVAQKCLPCVRWYWGVALALVVVSLLLLGLQPAAAQVSITTACPGDTCVTIINRGAGGLGKSIEVPKGYDFDEQDARDEKWVQYCRPRIVVDDYGVNRYVYERKGCEYGRSQ